MPLPILPTAFDLTASSSDDFDEETGSQIVQGQTYVLPVALVDENGDPFDASGWDLRAQLREDVADRAGTILAEFTAVWLDAALGQARISLTATETTAIKSDGGRWDLEIENFSDPGYDIGFVQRVLKGVWTMDREVTAS